MIDLAGIALVITAVTGTIAATGALINGFAIRTVHIAINSRMDQLLAAKGVASEADGVQKERARLAESAAAEAAGAQKERDHQEVEK